MKKVKAGPRKVAQTQDSIKVLTEVVTANQNRAGSSKTTKVANEKIRELIPLL